MRSSVAVPRGKRSQASVCVLRKYRRLRRRRSLRREYQKLRSLLPGAHRTPQLRKKVGVVDAAYQYICQLQSALIAKFSTKGLPADLAGVVGGKVSTASDIQALALHLIHTAMSPHLSATSRMIPRMNPRQLSTQWITQHHIPAPRINPNLPTNPQSPLISSTPVSGISQNLTPETEMHTNLTTQDCISPTSGSQQSPESTPVSQDEIYTYSVLQKTLHNQD